MSGEAISVSLRGDCFGHTCPPEGHRDDVAGGARENKNALAMTVAE